MIQIVKPAYAYICNSALGRGSLDCIGTPADPINYFNNILQAIIGIVFIVAIIYFIWNVIFAGFRMVSSQGDPKGFETAKNQLLYAFIGLIIIFSIFAILTLIGTITGIQGLEQLKLTLPTL